MLRCNPDAPRCAISCFGRPAVCCSTCGTAVANTSSAPPTSSLTIAADYTYAAIQPNDELPYRKRGIRLSASAKATARLADEPPLKLRRSAEASAKAEASCGREGGSRIARAGCSKCA